MIENLKFSFQSIWAHKMRSFLTMLGVIIGIASIIGIVSTIKGTNEQIMQNLIGAGNNNVTISLKQGDSDYWMDGGAPAGVSQVSDDQKERIRKLDNVADASFYLSRSYSDSVQAGNNTLDSAQMLGIDTHYLNTTGYVVYAGRPFTDVDYSGFHKVVLLDETASKVLFPDGDALGKIMTIKGEPYTVVGLVRKEQKYQPTYDSLQDYMTYAGQESGKVMLPDADWPISYNYDEPQNCVARAKRTEDMSQVGKEVQEIMNESVSSTGTDSTGDSAISYQAEDLLEKAKNKQQLAASTNNLLIWIASIALLVGGIGVMNIMLVSVTERTSEIGLKKALGARKKRILAQFLTESAVLTSMGGILGVVVGIILAEVISRSSGTPVAISIPSIFIGVGFSMAIGILFGLLPSIKAANLNPIDALRRE
ncbi:MAG: ABC transporter permease [Eubacterium sp.]|nr:ABC transporter permease [Eubacterium sp.]